METTWNEQTKYANRNMKARCIYCFWHGYVEDCNIKNNELECPHCGQEDGIEISGDDFSEDLED